MTILCGTGDGARFVRAPNSQCPMILCVPCEARGVEQMWCSPRHREGDKNLEGGRGDHRSVDYLV